MTITLSREPDHVVFAVADDGVGMNDQSMAKGDTLVSMRDRIGAVNGALEITSAPGHGTTVTGIVRSRSGVSVRRRPIDGRSSSAEPSR